MRTKAHHALLVEIMAALLFFALTATVIMQVYVTARSQSDEALLLSDVLMAAQNLADETYLAEQVTAQRIDCGAYILRVETTEELTDAGVLRRAVVIAEKANDGTVLVQLPCTRYLPGKEAVQ